MALPDLGTKRGDFLDLIDRQVRSAEKLVQVMRNTRVSFTRYEKNVADIRLISIAEAEGSPAHRPTSEVVRACAAAGTKWRTEERQRRRCVGERGATLRRAGRQGYSRLPLEHRYSRRLAFTEYWAQYG